MKATRIKLLLLSILLLCQNSHLAAQHSLWVGEQYQCFLEDYANRAYDWVNIKWSVDYGLYQNYSGKYVTTVSFQEYTNATKEVEVHWTETKLSDSSDSFRHKSHTWTFTCKDNPLVLSQSTIDLNIGDKKQLDCKFKYNNSYTQTITYSSSDNRVAAVNVGGLVTANAEGTATITAKSASSRYEVSCVVTVTTPVNEPTAITISPTSKTINVGETFYASYTLTPSNAQTTVTWSSDDSSIASVDSKTGLVTGKKAGYTYINATTTNGKTDWCKVTVENDAKLSLSANPSGGSVTSGTKVYLTASSNGSTVSSASIYYTLNGNKPTTNSNKYTSSGIIINESCTLKAFATKSGYNDSNVMTWNFTVSTNDIIEINSTNFPDKAFRDWILEQDYGKDGKLTKTEISEVRSIDVSGYFDNPGSITNLKGIEFFTALTELDCGFNQLTALDVSKNTALTELGCGYNQLTALDVSKNTALTHLLCKENQLTALDVSKNTALTQLVCDYNQLTALDVSKNTALTYLGCDGNQLTALDVSKNTALTWLYCSGNQLTSLDVSKNTKLEDLWCSGNQLTSLDVSKNTKLENLLCFSNQLTSLDVSKNTKLENLWCYNNQLTTLDVSKNTALYRLECYGNQIRGQAMDNLISSLRNNSSSKMYRFYVLDPTRGSEGNVCTKAQVAAVKAKGWTPYYYNGNKWLEYEGSDASDVKAIKKDSEADAPIYNLRGQRLAAPQKGINIIGGKKVVVK